MESNSKKISYKEQRIEKITQLYYSKPDIQKAIFEFSKNREVVPSYMMETFGKRPDSFQYKGDIFELVKKGATSFHCSEELWQDPLKLSVGMTEKQLNELRIGWDLVIDIDSKYIDYSKVSTELIIKILKFHGIKNVGVKFSGSKGFHLIIPWEAFPQEVNNVKTSDMFPEWPRIITKYIIEQTRKQLIEKITDLERPSKYVKDFKAPREVMPDIVLVSPRHLFRIPYSLHEKTALVSVVLNQDEIADFQLIDADPLKVKVKNFMPDSRKEEAKELLIQALDWGGGDKDKRERKNSDYKSIKLSDLSEKNFPPCVHKILQGMKDGKKRALFVLINLFRSVGMERQELENMIEDWNKKNNPPLKQGYIKSQLSWSYRKKPIMPSNCKEFYQGIGVCFPDDLCNLIKNPVNYVVRKNFRLNKFRAKSRNNNKF